MSNKKWQIWTKIVNRGEGMPPHVSFLLINMHTKQVRASYATHEWAQYMLFQLEAEEAEKAQNE
jgi:hypothetical protein